MDDQILDHLDDFEERQGPYRGRIITLKYFDFENEAQLYRARLHKEGIPCFLSNTNSSTVLAFGGKSIGLNVKADDVQAALHLVRELDRNARGEHFEEDFSEADKAEILYQKSLHERKPLLQNKLALLALVIISLLILRAFLRSSGMVPSWWDYF